jgi:hypothetical protein
MGIHRLLQIEAVKKPKVKKVCVPVKPKSRAQASTQPGASQSIAEQAKADKVAQRKKQLAEVSSLVEASVGPVARERYRGLILHPFGEGRMSKAQEFDETLLLDLAEQGMVAEAIYRVLKLSHRQPSNKIFSTTVSQLGKVMTQVADQLHLGVLGAPHPYRLRHTGASRDYLQKNRGLVDIQSRGRWKSAASFRRYQKGGRIQQQLQSLPRDVLGLALDAAKKRSSDLRNLRC